MTQYVCDREQLIFDAVAPISLTAMATAGSEPRLKITRSSCLDSNGGNYPVKTSMQITLSDRRSVMMLRIGNINNLKGTTRLSRIPQPLVHDVRRGGSDIPLAFASNNGHSLMPIHDLACGKNKTLYFRLPHSGSVVAIKRISSVRYGERAAGSTAAGLLAGRMARCSDDSSVHISVQPKETNTEIDYALVMTPPLKKRRARRITNAPDHDEPSIAPSCTPVGSEAVSHEIGMPIEQRELTFPVPIAASEISKSVARPRANEHAKRPHKAPRATGCVKGRPRAVTMDDPTEAMIGINNIITASNATRRLLSMEERAMSFGAALRGGISDLMEEHIDITTFEPTPPIIPAESVAVVIAPPRLPQLSAICSDDDDDDQLLLD